ncbi:helix-turn-helix transcriptional regulator [bacterium]|nr:helix-turn-helix transcriptional regulator [bacterium]
MTDIEIGKIIREARKKLGLSQQELAKKIGVTWEMISRYERGRSSALQKILELAEALEVEVAKFFAVSSESQRFSDTKSEYLSSRYIPVITVVPATLKELQQALNNEETGLRMYDNGEQIEKFGIRLGPESKLRIASTSLLPKGVLVCTFALRELSEKSLVLVSRNGLVSVEQYPGDAGVTVLARVIEWVVKL